MIDPLPISYPISYPIISCALLLMALTLVWYRLLKTKKYAQELEQEITKKSREIAGVISELRTARLKLLEIGKVSALASLSAGILHQLSQPVTAIYGFVRFIKKEMKDSDPFYRPIALMEGQSVYIKNMLEDLMELVRHRGIRKDNIDVNVPLRKAAALLTDELRIKRINWDLLLEENLPLVYADSIHLQQIFMNIMINAMEALNSLPPGANRYLKVTSRWDKEAGKITLSFTDTGPGISQETLTHLFEPFFSTKANGAGIGLALCKDLIAEHGGQMTAKSEAGKGATFIVKLPISNSAPSAAKN